MNSSKRKTSDNLAAKRDPSELLVPLRDLANLRDDPASFEGFASRWTGFIRVSDFDRTGNDRIYAYGELVPVTRMPPNLPTRFLLMWQAREALREIWRGNSEKLTGVLLPSPDSVVHDPEPEWGWPPQLKMDWQRGEFVYMPGSDFQRAVYELFRRSPLAKVCANPDCPHPYFIAGKTAQRYCSEACAKVFQRKWKRRWWKEKGTKWRRKKSRRKRGKR
jgi:hypothetical protein